MMALCALLRIPQTWYSINEICADFYLCDFDGSNPFILDLHGDVIIFARNPKRLILWYEKKLAHNADLRDDGVWHIAVDPSLCSFRFTGGQAPSKGEVQDEKEVAWFDGVHIPHKEGMLVD
jgi:hypothetical protein